MTSHPELQELLRSLRTIYKAVSDFHPPNRNPPILDSSLEADAGDDGHWSQNDHIPGLKKLKDALKLDLDGLEKVGKSYHYHQVQQNLRRLTDCISSFSTIQALFIVRPCQPTHRISFQFGMSSCVLLYPSFLSSKRFYSTPPKSPRALRGRVGTMGFGLLEPRLTSLRMEVVSGFESIRKSSVLFFLLICPI
jgi:hypothetical protein